MEEDADLTHLLAQAAEPPSATPDSFREVLVRHRRGRTRALGAGLAAVALLGPAAGIAVGRATVDHPTQVATAGAPRATATGSPGASGGTDASGGSGGTTAAGSVTEPRPVGGPGFPPFFQTPPAKRLFIRTTADGVTIRAYLQDTPQPQGEAHCSTDKGEVPCPAPPPECSAPDVELQVGLSDEGAVAPGFAPVRTADQTGPLAVLHASYFGVMEGDPAAWVAVKAGTGVARVRVRFSDGATDDMVPVDGYAVFAHRTQAPAPPTPQPGSASSPAEAEALMRASLPQGSAEALDATGAVVSTADLASATGAFSPQCAIAGAPEMPLLPGGATASTAPAVSSASPAITAAPATAPSATTSRP